MKLKSAEDLDTKLVNSRKGFLKVILYNNVLLAQSPKQYGFIRIHADKNIEQRIHSKVTP